MAMRDEFELSGSHFFSPCSLKEAKVMQLLQACAPAGQAHAFEGKPPGSAAVCSGGRGNIHEPASSSRGSEGPEADTVTDLQASMRCSAGHQQPAASSGADRGANRWVGEAECACSGREAHTHHALLASSEPDQALGLTASPASAPPGVAADEAHGGACSSAQNPAAGEALDELPRAAAAGIDRSPEGAGAAGIPAGQSVSEASTLGGLQQGPQHGRGFDRVDDNPAVGAAGGGGRPHAALCWAEAGYLPANPLVRTAAGRSNTAIAYLCLFSLYVCVLPQPRTRK